MKIQCIWEHNENDTILYARDYIGAFTRGASLEEAKAKMPGEIKSYLRWSGGRCEEEIIVCIEQEKDSQLEIRDADSDVIFYAEAVRMMMGEYQNLKKLVLKSAKDFQTLYELIPDKNASCLPVRKTFYGQVPRTAEEMYQHTKNVNAYYFREVDVDADNEGTISGCRMRGFDLLESQPDFLNKGVFTGSYDEEWSLRKMMRRFIWHDRIHAKAMWRMAEKTFGEGTVENVFCFD